MKLQFRGKSYDAIHVKWDINEGEVGGIYRGKPWKVHYLKEQHCREPVISLLTYRGISYTKDRFCFR